MTSPKRRLLPDVDSSLPVRHETPAAADGRARDRGRSRRAARSAAGRARRRRRARARPAARSSPARRTHSPLRTGRRIATRATPAVGVLERDHRVGAGRDRRAGHDPHRQPGAHAGARLRAGGDVADDRQHDRARPRWRHGCRPRAPRSRPSPSCRSRAAGRRRVTFSASSSPCASSRVSSIGSIEPMPSSTVAGARRPSAGDRDQPRVSFVVIRRQSFDPESHTPAATR